MIHLFSAFNRIAAGQSYWKVKLASNRWISELDSTFDMSGWRLIDWGKDIVKLSNSGEITELWLCTPQGDTHLPITEPNTAFQFSSGFANLWTQQRTTQAQIIGRLNNRESGLCTAVVWDAQTQKQYDLVTSVKDFAAWREGAAHVGALNIAAMGVKLEVLLL